MAKNAGSAAVVHCPRCQRQLIEGKMKSSKGSGLAPEPC
jgi:hypothetical protein